MSSTSELLKDLSVDELEALADSLLAPAAQIRLDDLLGRKKEKPLSAEEEAELERLLQKADQLTILKTRARYTLSQAKAEGDRDMTAYLSVELQRQVRERFANYCAYCRTAEDLTATTFEFEHILPRCAGGETAFENLCLSCPMCNRYKSDQLLAFDAVTQMETPLFHPHMGRWTDHFAWTEECTEVIGLTAVGRATVVALKMNRPQMIRVRRMWVAMSEHPPDLD